MVNEEVLRIVAEAGMRLSAEAAQMLDKMDDATSVVRKLAEGEKDEFIITAGLLHKYAERERPAEETKIPLPVEVYRSPDFKPEAAEHESDLLIESASEVVADTPRPGTLDNFVEYFNDRFRRTRSILHSRPGENSIQSIASVMGMVKGSKARVAGIVNGKHITKNGNLLIDIEDDTGPAKVLVTNRDSNHALFADANCLVLDEVVGFDCSVSAPFLFANTLLWPDVPIRNPKMSERDLSIAFLSDVHVASRHFLEPQFKSMLQWLNGDGKTPREREMAGRIKYLVMSGDLVDGIGIYPSQERELVVKDIYEQYRLFGKFMEDVPDYIEIVLAPGNHDAVRRAEPQPAFSEDIQKEINGPSRGNMHFTTSPSTMMIEGLRVISYHGTSLDSMIASMPGMSYSQPEKPMTELLKRRNLSPIYGENPIVPEKKDFMVIGEVPDILVMGHIHKNGYTNYHGTSVINAGTWQDRTDFQRQQGHMPSPCIMPIFNTRYARLDLVNFREGT
ncbi:DNA polymerase II small subunit [Candidatus Burarchaeum australiense]|nr:DNA polymerase II small subunit [Candidatus Burarchaeum australiense]